MRLRFPSAAAASAVTVSLVACGSSDGESPVGTATEALHYERAVETCGLQMTFEDLDTPYARTLPKGLTVNITSTWTPSATIDVLRGEGWTCRPVEEDPVPGLIVAPEYGPYGYPVKDCGRCDGTTICRRNSDDVLVVPDDVTSCECRPDLKKIFESRLGYLYRREITFSDGFGAAPVGPGDQVLRDTLLGLIANEHELEPGGYEQPVKVGPNDRALIGHSSWFWYFQNGGLKLDQATTNRLAREWGGVLPPDASLPAFPPLRLEGIPYNGVVNCVQAHLPSTVANGASFHLCGCYF